MATYRRETIEQLRTNAAVSIVKPYAVRFAKIYLALTFVATVGMLILGVAIMPGLVFDWFLGPMYVGTNAHIMLTSTTVATGSVALFVGGIAYERYR